MPPLLLAAALAISVSAPARTWRNQDGKKLEADLVGVEGSDVILAKPDAPEVTLKYPLKELGDKDKEYVDAWQTNRNSRVGQLLWDKLVKAKPSAKPKKNKKDGDKEEKSEQAPADPTKPEELFNKVEGVPGTKHKYYVLYFSAKWSPYDRKFTPKLVDYYQSKRPKNPDKSTVGAGLSWDVYLISADRNAADLAAYMNDFDMPWPALEYEQGLHSPLVRYRGPGLPCLVVLDSDGNVLIDTFKGHEYRGPEAALDDLKKLIESGPEALEKKD